MEKTVDEGRKLGNFLLSTLVSSPLIFAATVLTAMLGWNWFIPEFLGYPKVSFWEAAAIITVSIVFLPAVSATELKVNRLEKATGNEDSHLGSRERTSEIIAETITLLFVRGLQIGVLAILRACIS